MLKSIFYKILLLSLISSCSSSSHKELKILYKLPKSLKEVSGIAIANQSIWVIEDSGNENHIYSLNQQGKIKNEITLPSTKNIDWEDLSTDFKGNLYIGDFGNNENRRKDLCIYAINKEALNNKSIDSLSKITFNYPEQTKFPPKKKKLLYDCEAFFEWNGYFYLFTKNRSNPFDGTSLIYKIPNSKGNHNAELVATFTTCFNDKNCTITSAAISPTGTKVVLLSHDSIWLLEGFESDYFTKGKVAKLELNHVSQKEAVCFKNESTLLIADEKNNKQDGNVYEVKLNELKSKS